MYLSFATVPIPDHRRCLGGGGGGGGGGSVGDTVQFGDFVFVLQIRKVCTIYCALISVFICDN